MVKFVLNLIFFCSLATVGFVFTIESLCIHRGKHYHQCRNCILGMKSQKIKEQIMSFLP